MYVKILKLLLIPLITALFLVALWFSYYNNHINSFVYIGVLLVTLFIVLIFLIVFRNHNNSIGKIKVMAIMVILVFLFDFRLINYEAYTYRVSSHAEPIEVIKDSGINLMVVRTFEILNVEDKKLIESSLEKENHQVISIEKFDNKIKYRSKNKELLQMVMVKKDAFDIMGSNVKKYLSRDIGIINEFVEREDISGDSAGLGLALSGLLQQNKLFNRIPIGVTGAITPAGDVTLIGMIKEKLLIAEQNNLPYMIIPDENASEANKVKKEYKLSVEIFSVSHIDQAILIINKLND